MPAKDVIEPWVQVYLILVDVLEQLFCSQHLRYANKLFNTCSKQLIAGFL